MGIFTRAATPPSGIPGNPDVNFGIFALANNDGKINRAGFFNGQVESTGGYLVVSDAKLKQDISALTQSAMSLVEQLEVQSYRYRQDIPELNLPLGTQYGFIAPVSYTHLTLPTKA